MLGNATLHTRCMRSHFVGFFMEKSDCCAQVQVQEGEGQALAKSRKNSAYLAISLADGTGVDLVFQSLARLMMGDPNITVSKWKSV